MELSLDFRVLGGFESLQRLREFRAWVLVARVVDGVFASRRTWLADFRNVCGCPAQECWILLGQKNPASSIPIGCLIRGC